MVDSTQSDRGRREAPIRIGAVLALGLAAAFIAWLVVRSRDSGDNGASRSPVTHAAAHAAPPTRKIVTAATLTRLRTLATASTRPIYWAGARAGTTYELTQTTDGRIYIRYLPSGVKIGDTRARYLIVATYPLPNAYRAVQTAAKENGAVTFRLPRGGLALYNRAAPTNVYFAYPGTRFQVEVYDPNPLRARRLVASGKIRPIS